MLLTPAALRPLLAKFLRRAMPQLAVLAHNEIPDNKTIRIISVVGGREASLMVVKSFGATTRDALKQVRNELGEDALILSTARWVVGGNHGGGRCGCQCTGVEHEARCSCCGGCTSAYRLARPGGCGSGNGRQQTRFVDVQRSGAYLCHAGGATG